MRSERAASTARLLLMGLVLSCIGFSVAAASDPPEKEDSVRTLEAIQIEGEIAIPQVLFITSRDHPRFRDGLRERYRKSALEVGQAAVFPHCFRPLSEHPEPQK